MPPSQAQSPNLQSPLRPPSSAGAAAVPEPGAFQVLLCQGSEPTLQTRTYQRRRIHRKSKAGCLVCKVKRVKCDEDKPSCKRCQRHNTHCVYPSHSSVEPQCTPTEPSTSQASLDLRRNFTRNNSIVSVLGDPLLSMPAVDALDTIDMTHQQPQSPCGTSRIFLLHHFRQLFSHIELLGPLGTDAVVELGLSRPYLLDAVLAVAASHLRHSTPSSAAYCVAEHFQQGLTLRSFQQALTQSMDQKSADALILTSMMLNLLSFSVLGGVDPLTSWVFSEENGRLNWFSLQLGLRPLLYATCDFREKSMLQWMYESSDDEHHNFHGQGPHSLDAVPKPWRALCDLLHQPSEDDIFHEPLRFLAILKDTAPSDETFLLYLGFFGVLGTDFRTLLEQGDERAMWILGYWFGLLCRFKDVWWMKTRTQRDYHAIQIWLQQRRMSARDDVVEAQMWIELIHDLKLAHCWSDTQGGHSEMSE